MQRKAVFGLLFGAGTGLLAKTYAEAPAQARTSTEDASVSQSALSHSHIQASMTRIDTTRMYKKYGAWHNSLRQPNMVEDIELYVSEKESKVAGVYRLGCSLCGHMGIIHGGITAMAFDDTFGLCYYALNRKENLGIAYTANLDVNYRKPLPCGQDKVVFNVSIDRVEGRKIFMKGIATDKTGEVKYAESTALFVVAKKKE